ESHGTVWAVGTFEDLASTNNEPLILRGDGGRFSVVNGPNPSGGAGSDLIGGGVATGDTVWGGGIYDNGGKRPTLTPGRPGPLRPATGEGRPGAPLLSLRDLAAGQEHAEVGDERDGHRAHAADDQGGPEPEVLAEHAADHRAHRDGGPRQRPRARVDAG